MLCYLWCKQNLSLKTNLKKQLLVFYKCVPYMVSYHLQVNQRNQERDIIQEAIVYKIYTRYLLSLGNISIQTQAHRVVLPTCIRETT